MLSAITTFQNLLEEPFLTPQQKNIVQIVAKLIYFATFFPFNFMGRKNQGEKMEATDMQN